MDRETQSETPPPTQPPSDALDAPSFARQIFGKKSPLAKKYLEILGIGLRNPEGETKEHQEYLGNGHKKPPNRGGTGEDGAIKQGEERVALRQHPL